MFKQNNNNENWRNYCKSRNKYRAEIVKAKNNNIKQKIANANDQKSMWRTIKSYILKQNIISTAKTLQGMKI